MRRLTLELTGRSKVILPGIVKSYAHSLHNRSSNVITNTPIMVQKPQTWHLRLDSETLIYAIDLRIFES